MARREIDADGLILIKSVPGASNDVQELAAAGYLDGYFPQLLKETNLGLHACVSINEREVLRQALLSGTIPLRHQLGVY